MKKKLFIVAGVVIALASAILITIGVGNELSPGDIPTVPDGSYLLNDKPEIGGTVKFGSYEQDGDLTNGNEPIEWIVLKDINSQLTLLSLKGLDSAAFASENEDTTWETSAVRTLLNDSFFKSAFSDTERAAVAKMSLTNPDNPTYGTDGGNDTEDYVYLMSIDEYNNLLLDTGNAPCTPTAYAVSRGVKPNSKTGRQLCSWWLRTPGDEAVRAAAFFNSTEAFYGSMVNTVSNAVRPMITINYTNSAE